MNNKIIILGSSGSGKTTTLKHICNDMVKTAAMDYGKTTINGKKVHFFCPSGHERFKFMQEVLSKNIDGAIIIIDSSKGITPTEKEFIEYIKLKRVPYVIFANKHDLKNMPLNNEFKLVIPTVATIGQGIENGLSILLGMIDGKMPLKNSEIICTC